MVELSISETFEDKLCNFSNQVYRICSNYEWFKNITDRTIISDSNRIELQNLSWEEQAIEREIAYRVVNEFDCSEIINDNWHSIGIGLRKLRRYYSDRTQLKNALLDELDGHKKTIKKFNKSKKSRKDVEVFIKENFEQCPLTNVIGIFDIYSK